MILSSVRCRVNCRNGGRFITRLTAREIAVRDLEITDTYISLIVKCKQLALVKSVALEYGYDLVVERYYGLKGLFTKGLVFLPYTMTVILTSILTIIASCYVYNLDVSTVDGNRCYEVEHFLVEQGFGGILPKTKIDTKSVEQLVLTNMTNVNFATCYIDGMSLKVTVSVNEEGKLTEKSSSLTAITDGVVSRVIVRGGTPLVNEGDRVKIGQELIAGYHIADNTPTDGEENGEKIECIADGEVYGIVYYQKRLVIPSQAVYMQATGRKKMIRQVYLGDWRIGKEHKKPFEHYQCTRTVSKMINILPFTFETFTYYEYSEQILDRESYIEKVLTDTRKSVMDSMPIDGKIMKETHKIKNVDNSEILYIYIEVEQRLDNGGNNY